MLISDFVVGWKMAQRLRLSRENSKQTWCGSPCRHHVCEVIGSAVYHVVLGHSTAPEVLLFKTLQKKWKEIDFSRLEIPHEYPKMLDSSRREEILTWAQLQTDVRFDNLLFYSKQKLTVGLSISYVS